jgi:hypothetical protein
MSEIVEATRDRASARSGLAEGTRSGVALGTLGLWRREPSADGNGSRDVFELGAEGELFGLVQLVQAGREVVISRQGQEVAVLLPSGG